MRARVVILAICGTLAAGCGVPTADDPSTAAADEVPYGLLDARRETTTTLLASAAATIWLVIEESIVPVTREVAAPANLARVVEALASGATDAEGRLGLRSALSAEAVNDVSIDAGVATVDLSDEFVRAAPREQLFALGQLVFTATELDSVAVVRFTLDGQAVEVPRGDGSVSKGPVTRRDYTALTD